MEFQPVKFAQPLRISVGALLQRVSRPRDAAHQFELARGTNGYVKRIRVLEPSESEFR